MWTVNGIEDFPWLHCRNMLDVDRLLAVGATYNSPAIGLNIEDVKSDFTDRGISLQDIAQKLAAWQKPIHMATLPWMQNGQGWGILSRCVAALEIFPDENEASKDVSGCIEHAFAEGLSKVTLMFKTKLPPTTFDLSICHSLYTSDDIAPTLEAWEEWKAPAPCSKPMPAKSFDPRRLWAVPCKVGPQAAKDSGLRRASDIDLVVIHTAEAADLSGADNTAEGVANYFAREDVQASTQLAVDRDSCVRMLPDLIIPWGATGANSNGLHMEICGRAGWSKEQWLAPEIKPMLALAAAKTAKWCWQHKIPRRWLNIAELKAGKRGLTTHVDVNAAFQGGSHWDPGPNFPRDLFIGKVRYWYEQIRLERER